MEPAAIEDGGYLALVIGEKQAVKAACFMCRLIARDEATRRGGALLPNKMEMKRCAGAHRNNRFKKSDLQNYVLREV